MFIFQSKEEKRTYRDESGTEVTTVTRSLGPQQYSHTTKTHPDGRKENTEDYINISDSECYLVSILSAQNEKSQSSLNMFKKTRHTLKYLKVD